MHSTHVNGKKCAREAYFSRMVHPRMVHVLRLIKEHTILSLQATLPADFKAVQVLKAYSQQYSSSEVLLDLTSKGDEV